MLIRLTRDLTIEDFSDLDLSDITYDAYTSSMESLNKINKRYFHINYHLILIIIEVN